eukprot:5134610-Pyramimonas_sp.AAC.1
MLRQNANQNLDLPARARVSVYKFRKIAVLLRSSEFSHPWESHRVSEALSVSVSVSVRGSTCRQYRDSP